MSTFDSRNAEILDCLVYRKDSLEITILTADHGHPWDGIELNKEQTPEINPEVHRIRPHGTPKSSAMSASNK
jgi:hypothetical protein